MIVVRIRRALSRLFVLAVTCAFLQAGCGDDSKTTGTQVELSPEAKAQIKDMRDMYKENKGMKKAAGKKKGFD
jgi:hypothetical protein